MCKVGGPKHYHDQVEQRQERDRLLHQVKQPLTAEEQAARANQQYDLVGYMFQHVFKLPTPGAGESGRTP